MAEIKFTKKDNYVTILEILEAVEIETETKDRLTGFIDGRLLKNKTV